MSDIVFMDTETLGLDPAAPVWEFAAIRRREDGSQKEFHCFITHRPHPWLGQLPDQFKADYLQRFRLAHVPHGEGVALTIPEAAQLVNEATAGAHVIGAVPNFDTERLARLLKRAGIKPSWHYHLVDVENLVVGYLAAKGELLQPPWKSDDLSRAVGVDPERFQRHTAMGDVLWTEAQYDAVMAS